MAEQPEVPAGGPSFEGGGVTEEDRLYPPTEVRRFQVEIVEGNQVSQTWESSAAECSIGADPANNLVLQDQAVSRFHCEIRVDKVGARLRDLGSRNGTLLDGVPVIEAYLREGSLLRVGRSTLRFHFSSHNNKLPISLRNEFGSMVGQSAAIRTVFAVFERAAGTDSTILIEGETGTGKEMAAESIHNESPRRDKPFVVVDCGSLPKDLLETELFGHERGSFTGAAVKRIGAFEEAHTGTIFLDEIGELDPLLQPKLLRVLESREIRRLGSNDYLPCDVRVIAATNRDLRSDVNTGRFRSDLYFRLSVVRVNLPPLRVRPEDIPLLARRMLANLGMTPEATEALMQPEFIGGLQRAIWPGNVRELRNYLERCVIFNEAQPLTEASNNPMKPADPRMSYDQARRRAIDEFERHYVAALLTHHKNNVTEASRGAKLARSYLHRLIRRHNI